MQMPFILAFLLFAPLCLCVRSLLPLPVFLCASVVSSVAGGKLYPLEH